MCVCGFTPLLTAHWHIPLATLPAQSPCVPRMHRSATGLSVTSPLSQWCLDGPPHPTKRRPRFPFKPAWPERSQQCCKQREHARNPIISFPTCVTSVYQSTTLKTMTERKGGPPSLSFLIRQKEESVSRTCHIKSDFSMDQKTLI